MTHDPRLQEMAAHRENMPWADGVTRSSSMIVTGPSDADQLAQAAHFVAMLDDLDCTAEDIAALAPIRQTLTLCDQTGERQSLPVLLSGPTSDDDEITAWRIVEPKWVSPYDKAFLALHNAEARLEALPADDAHYHERQKALLPLSRAKAEYRLELERSTDDAWRERRRIDEERFYGVGTEERNAARRSRVQPNTMTPKEVLAAESDAERQARIAAQKVASKKRTKATLTIEQKEAAKAKDAERKRLKRAASQMQK
jgi:hypothetical protein